jgi:formate dehydrogenase alpha subunit
LEKIHLTINGNAISCLPGTSILKAAQEQGIKIPTLCHHPHLSPVGACRLCLVEEVKRGRLLASCVALVAPDMVIQTETPTLKKLRMDIVRLMMASHPESCLVCSKGNRCELRRVAAELGVGQIGFYPMPHYTGLEEANPFIVRDLSKCLLCAKCIRADHELVVAGAIDYHLRGFKCRPATLHDMPLEKSNCTFCGTCVSMCPTGALSVKNARYVGTPQRQSPTVCGFCGVGCSLVMASVDGQVVEVNPSHREETVNRSTLCVRGHFVHDFLNVSERLTCPLIRRNGELSPATWDEALEFVAQGLLSMRKDHGPQSVAFFGSSKCTTEENYLFQKIARVILGTNNVDNGGYGSGRTVASLINEKLDGGGRVTPLAGLEKAEVILVIGANPTQSAPGVGYYLKRASRIKGIPLIVADPRKTELVPFSSLWLPLTPHSDGELINGLAAILCQRKAYDAQFIDRFTEGFDLYRDSLSSLDLEKVSRATKLDRSMIEKAAESLEGKKIAFVIGHGILQQKFGTSASNALLNLALMTGSLGGEARGLYFLAMENNEVGAWDMGTAPDFLPGRQAIRNHSLRKHWEQLWEVGLSPEPGLNIVRMVEEAERGNLKALYIMGENPLRSLPQPERVSKALGKLELLVVQDILATETTRSAHVILPGAAFSEKGGSFTSLEGRIQSFEPVVSPPGEARPDWEILDLLAARMGHPKWYSGLQEIRAEISQFVPLYTDLPANAEAAWLKETSSLMLFRPDGEGGPIRFSPVVSTADDPADEDYPHRAILGSLPYHLGSGTRTSRSARIKNLAVKGEVEIAAEDASRLHLKEGDKVRISSPYGSITREVRLRKGLRPGLVFVPLAFQENGATRLLRLTELGEADSPGWKECRVRIEKREG